jgi:hypothetical protein
MMSKSVSTTASIRQPAERDLLRRWRKAQTRRAILELPAKLDALTAAVRELTSEVRRRTGERVAPAPPADPVHR